MNLLVQLQELDDLIVRNTTPPATPILRQKLYSIREQLEAHLASEKQTATEFANLKQAHTALQDEHAKFKAPQFPEPPALPNYGSQTRIKGRMEQ